MTSARTQLDDIQRQWQADKAALAPMADTAVGQGALLQLGQLRLHEATKVITDAQAGFAGAANQIHGITARLLTHTPKPNPGAKPADFVTGGPDGTPEPPGPHTVIDPDNPFVGDPRFGRWENHTPRPYTDSTPVLRARPVSEGPHDPDEPLPGIHHITDLPGFFDDGAGHIYWIPGNGEVF